MALDRDSASAKHSECCCCSHDEPLSYVTPTEVTPLAFPHTLGNKQLCTTLSMHLYANFIGLGVSFLFPLQQLTTSCVVTPQWCNELPIHSEQSCVSIPSTRPFISTVSKTPLEFHFRISYSFVQLACIVYLLMHSFLIVSFHNQVQ